MKRILFFLLAIAMLFSCSACTSSLPEEAISKTEEKKTVANEKTKEDLSDYTLPEGFSVGYSRIDCTPQVELPIYNATAKITHDPLMITCTAVADGEKVALLISADLKGITRSVATQCMKTLEKAYGIPAEYVLISATHTHSAPTIGGDSDSMLIWMNSFYKQLKTVVGEALADLTPAKAYGGVSQTKNLNFVRRYLLADGGYKMSPTASDKPIAHETESDPELRTVRFEREGKKDVLMINYQTHYGFWVDQYSADFVYYLRQIGEKDMDVHLAYYSGSSANLQMNTRLAGEAHYIGEDCVRHMWEVAKDAVANEKTMNTGKIRAFSSLYEATVRKDSAERRKQAKEVYELEKHGKAYGEKLREYGFQSIREVWSIITRGGYGEKLKVPFSAISFGDIAFAAAPIEQFDQSGMQVREGSPFEMTFTLSLTNGNYGYVPTKEVFPHGSYEVYVCYFTEGTAEEFVAEEIRLLNECYNAVK